MKLHLPKSLRSALLACISAAVSLTTTVGTAVFAGGVVSFTLAGQTMAATATSGSTYTISGNADANLTGAAAGDLLIMQLNGGWLLNTNEQSGEVLADVQIDVLSISDGYRGASYTFSGSIFSGPSTSSGLFERTSSAASSNQTYIFTGDMSAYSGDMKLSKVNSGDTIKFDGNQSGTGAITIAAGNTIEVAGSTMNNSAITTAGTLNVSGCSTFAGDVTINGTLNLAEGAEIINNGTFTFGADAVLNLVNLVASTDASRTVSYALFSSASTGTSYFDSLSHANITGVVTAGRTWSFNADGTLVGVLNNRSLSYAGGNFSWNTSSADFSKDDEKVTFTQGDDVTFTGTTTISFGETLAALRMSVADGAEVTISSGGSGSLALEDAVVHGTLNLNKGGESGAFSGAVDVYGTLNLNTGDVTGWSNSLGIKSIDIMEGGEMAVKTTGNQTGAGLAINLQGGTISGVAGSNFDFGYGGSNYGYSSISALAAESATAENPTVSTIENCNITLRQNHTTISVEDNARLDISSGILALRSNAGSLNSEGAVSAGLVAGLVKTGAGELRLSGNNTYTHATTVAEGTLTLTGGGALASSSVTVQSGAAFQVDTAAETAFSYSGELLGAGAIVKTGAGSATLGNLADSFAGSIALQGGSLNLGDSLVIGTGRELSLGMTSAVLESALTLGGGRLSIDYSGSGAATSLNNSALTLLGGTQLQLSNLGSSTDHVYDLFSGVGRLLGSDGSALVLNAGNNAAANYFDVSQLGSAFSNGSILQLSANGTLQLVRYDDAVTITTRQTGNVNYQYYAGVLFKEISSSTDGGAIYGDRYSTITLSDNGSVTFSGNTATGSSYAYGGAIYGYEYSTITLSNNGSVVFEGNTSSTTGSYSYAYGGAIYGDYRSTITLSNNESVTFSGNTASCSCVYGGAIYGDRYSTITLSNNGSVTFSGNTASCSYYSSVYGGAIYGGSYSTITLRDNESVVFEGNTTSTSANASAYGGAIYGVGDITLSNNGCVVFEGNSSSTTGFNAAYGGAIYGDYRSTITLSNNGSVTFSGNTASGYSAYGGAIYTDGNLSIRNNDSVEFYQNAEVEGGVYRLRSIYAGGSGDVISLSTSAGKSISFRDSIYIGSGSTFKLNEAYEGMPQQGDIIFTGATTEADLYAVKGNVAGTEKEILLSCTTEVNALTELHGGRLRVEEGAVYKGNGITAMEGSAATVRVQNAELRHSGYDLTFNAGTTLELVGNNIISGNVQMMEGSILSFDASETTGVTCINGDMSISGALTIANTDTWSVENTLLLWVLGMVTGSNDDYITVQGQNTLTWVGNDLVLNYNAATFDKYFNDEVTYTSSQQAGIYHHFERIEFENITTSSDGVAIYGGNVTLSGNGSVTFNGNMASGSSDNALGGAIYGVGDITLSNNGSVTFSENTASSSSAALGGAIYGYEYSTITLSNNGSVTFSENTASGSSSDSNAAAGGAIYGGWYSTITLSNNGSVTFSGNTASCSSSSHDNASGGAIYGGSRSTITLSNNESVTFNGNRAYSSSSYNFAASGGAIYGNTITLSNNGSVTFSGNTARCAYSSYSSFAKGGAISGYGDITLSNNGSVTFSGNTATGSDAATGGAIYATGNLSIRNNDSVEFYQNAEVEGGVYRLRSIYAGGSGDVISLSAAAGKSITFRDSIYIGSGSTFKLNEQYEGQAQQGDIIFTGATTVDDLYAVKGNVAGTAEEIHNSRTSEVYTMTNLYGGRLRVEDGAVYKGNGITSMEGSAATVRVQNATLSHEGYALTFNAGTTLELAGNNTISGNVQMLEGSILSFDASETTGVTCIDGDMSISGALTIANADTWSGENTLLLWVLGMVTGSNDDNITVQGQNTLTWVGNDLVLNYNAATFDKYFNDEVTYTSSQQAGVYHHFERMEFENITSSSDGGAIYGDSYSTITLITNGSVTFNGNTASGYYACGGAIYGGSYSTITLSDNESVVFSENTASDSSSHVYGGAIYGDSYSTITLSNNGSVTFSGNTASSSGYYAYGGAIYRGSYSTITLSNNGSVMFSENTASSTDDSAYGGAIYGNVTMKGNGDVSFSGNTASGHSAYGGAIYGGGDITLSNNGSVTFSGNTASGSSPYYAYGGAIYTYGNLSIRNNDSVEFYQNAEVKRGVYRLRSIYAGDSGDVISLSAAAGKSITFRDSIYIGRGSTFKLNEAYEGMPQQGDIIFTGATTVDDLYAVKGNVAGTEVEIRLSRTSEVNTLTELYGGRLRVEEGAVYKGNGITAMEGSAATVRVQNATLSHEGYDLTFNAGTTLELAGNNTISGNLQMMEGSILSFDASETTGVACINGDMSISGTLTIANTDTWSGENTHLLWVAGMVTGSNDDYITVQGQNTLTWVGNHLVLNYNAATFDTYFNDEVTYTGRQQSGIYHHFNQIVFENIASSSNGGAICGDFDITLSDNESVVFSGNTASGSDYVYGGAIYGGSSSTITLSDNESVVFSGNTATSSSYYALGGAIYGDSSSTITLRDNGSVTFSGNTATGSDSAYGGAIYGGSSSTITLSDNGSVTFSGNTASGSDYVYGGAIYGDSSSTITLSNNGSVMFSGNTASGRDARGGAIYGNVTMKGNGDVSFSGNTASGRYAEGGAIYGATITLSNNGSVTFSGNTATGSSPYAEGGAIYTYGDLSIQNNESVEFYQNAEVVNGNTYRLRSIYAYGGSGDEISLSAAAGKSITFRDSIYIGEGSSFKLNEQYEGQAQLGDIIFTGATTVDDLYTVKGNVAGTEEEIINSRTSEVYTMTNLYGGRLRVEEGAVYKGNGITAMEGSAATVRVQNATLSHEGYALTFNAGTTLELAGNNTISGNVQMLEGSTLRFISSAGGELTTHTGSLNVAGAVVVELQRGQKFEQGETHLGLFQTNDSDRTWNPTSVRVIAPADYGEGVVFAMGDVEWVDNVFGIRCYVSDTVHWNNAAGDGLWNNSSANWVSGGYSFARIQGTHVILGATGQGEITLVGDIAQRSLTVENGCSYELDFATDASLTVRENLVLGSGSVLTVHGDMAAAGVNAQGTLVVDGCLNVAGGVTAGSLQVANLTAGSLQAASLTARTLTLTDTAAVSTIGSSVSLSGAVAVAGRLDVTGSLSAKTIAGDANTLSATSYVIIGGDIAGSDNVLEAGTSIKVGAITGDGNELTAGTTIFVESIGGNENVLSADESIVTAAITGNENELTSDTSYVQVNGALKGDGNKLEGAEGNQWGNTVVITGGIQADADGSSDGNTITALNDKVTLGASGGNALVGSENMIIAQNNQVVLEGALSGFDNTLLAGTSISTGTITGNENELTSDTSYVQVNGALKGDGNKLEGAEGNQWGNTVVITGGIQADADGSSEGNTITALNGKVTLGASNGNALVGSENTINAEEGEVNLEGALRGHSNELSGVTVVTKDIIGNSNELYADAITTGGINGTTNKLVGETVNVNGKLEGSANKVTATTIHVNELAGTAQEIVSKGVETASDVAIDIDKLTGTNDIIEVQYPGKGSVNIDSMTAQTGAGDNGTTITTLAGNVTIGTMNTTAKTAINVGTSYGITVGSGSASNQTWTASSLSITGAEGVTLTDSTVTILGAVDATKLTLTDSSVTGNVDMNGALNMRDSSIGGNITGATSAILENAIITQELTAGDTTVTGTVTVGTAAVAGLTVGTGSTLTAAEGVSASGTLDIQGSVLAQSGNISLTGTDGSTISGAAITAENGDVVLSGTMSAMDTVLTADRVVVAEDAAITSDLTLNAALNMDSGAVIGGSVTGATSATLKDASITGVLTATGDVTALNSSVGALTTTGDVETVGAAIGALSTEGDVTALSGSIGSITGAADVTTEGTSMGDVTLSGKLTMTSGEADSVTGATDATLNNANIDGALNASGTVVVDGGSIGSITGSATTVDLDNVESIGSITMSTTGTLNVTDTVTGAVNAANGNTVANATLIDSMIGSGLNVTDTLDVIGDAGVAGNVTAGNLNVSDGMLYATDGNTLYDVTVNNKTTLSNGEVVAGTFTTKELELVDMAGEVEKLIAAGNVAMAGTSLDVSRTDADAVKVGASMTLTQGAILTNAGGAQITGDLKVDGSAFTNEGAVQAGSIAVQDGGVLTGTTVTANGVAVTNGTITGAVLADSAVLADATFGSGLSVTHDMEVAGQVSAQGSVAVGGKLTGTGVLDLAGSLTVGSLQAGTLETQMLTLTTQGSANTVSGDLTAGTVSLAAGSSLSVGGVLTANEVQMTGTALTLTAGSFGASSMNFELDRAALESLGLGTGIIAQADSVNAGLAVTLNGSASATAAVYKYTISSTGSKVQLTTDYRWKFTKVWYRGAWVGESSWEDYQVMGFDAVNGVEHINLAGSDIDAGVLAVMLEDGVSAVEFTGGSLSFDYVDILAGRLNIGQGASLTVREEMCGEDMVLGVSGSCVSVAGPMDIGTVELVNSSLSVHDASIGALNATSSEMTITAGGKVTIGSDVMLSGFVNEGSLDIGKHALHVDNIVRKGGSVTAGEVEVLCNNRTAATFDKLVADKVTVKQANEESPYPDFLSVGDGSAIGELAAEKLQVREGTVTLGRTSGATSMSLLELVLQSDASLVLNQQTTLEVTDTLTATENAMVQLKQDAAVSYDGVNIANRKESGTLSVNAYALSGEAELELNGAHVAATGSEDKVIDYKLVNSTVENAGTGTLQVTHAGNSLSGVVASSGNVEVYNVTESMSLDELRIATGLSVSLLTGGSGTAITPANEANVTVVGLAVFEKGATLNANLTMAAGSELRMEGPLHMGNTLELVSGADTITLSGSMYDAVAGMQLGESMTLFTGVDALVLSFDGVSVTYQPGDIQVADRVLASDYFGNLPVQGANQQYFITFTTAEVGGGELAFFMAPEPTTTTLSLLALAALAARRRRK